MIDDLRRTEVDAGYRHVHLELDVSGIRLRVVYSHLGAFSARVAQHVVSPHPHSIRLTLVKGVGVSELLIKPHLLPLLLSWLCRLAAPALVVLFVGHVKPDCKIRRQVNGIVICFTNRMMQSPRLKVQ